ncbi:phage integrase SAM-like domain-containing protein [Niabella sp. 22666]|uniref:phage integrase SAM-like domain-containing protein n=1 Tax=Niabella sp. 22666 TaxID=3453954 RepID=UPI003F87BF27
MVKQLIEEKRIGNAFNYQDAYYCLKRFKGNVRFEVINVNFLNRFEDWMMTPNACTRTTVGIKLRQLRVRTKTILNSYFGKGQKVPGIRRH